MPTNHHDEDSFYLREYVGAQARKPAGMWTGNICEMCEGEIDQAEESCECVQCGPSTFDPLEVEYIVDSKGNVTGVSLLVTVGGPNVWMHARLGYYAHVDGAAGRHTDSMNTTFKGDEIVDHYAEYIVGTTLTNDG